MLTNPLKNAGTRRYVAPSFDWTNISPSTSLAYVDCFNGLQCARLQVPMNWNSTTDEDTVAVAIVRVPARVPVTDPRYGGPILVNPGGPGGSGVGVAIAAGAKMQAVFDAAYLHNSSSYISDEPSAKYLDIIGFDPRGVKNTTPFRTCHSNPANQVTWSLQGDHLVLGSPETNTDYLWQRSVALGKSCP
ncbi:proteinase, putative [Metarhizium acridum CQMa 102]|uniref:Proteinase, putative n=1 Tax=Metarhizium acridum (strain CQMa 102) TaxID=655827 RepID=E9DZ22_METAQ|nr:proteinase, putative [Metarhizium acridum CQMa 102]EFY90984.1 proteinase, putative [Metarhizium acridum CQMa 102]